MPLLGRRSAPLLVCKMPNPKLIGLSLATVMPRRTSAFQCVPTASIRGSGFSKSYTFALYATPVLNDHPTRRVWPVRSVHPAWGCHP